MFKLALGASAVLLYGSIPSASYAGLNWSLVPNASPKVSPWNVPRPTSTKSLKSSSSVPSVTPAEPVDPALVLQPIEQLYKVRRAWPSPSLNPGVPSAFVAQWGNVFFSASAGTRGTGRLSRDDIDGSWTAGFGLGDAAKALALELSGGCGSIQTFCGNGGLGARLGRVLINQPEQRLGLALGWRNGVQWGYEGRQDNIYTASMTYAVPLRKQRTGFRQTLQINAGAGNSSFAPYSASNSESKVGGFGSVGVELSPALGVSAGWSGRGVNAQLSYTPLRDIPLSLNLLGADLFAQTPAGTVGVLSVSWGTNFATPNFASVNINNSEVIQ